MNSNYAFSMYKARLVVVGFLRRYGVDYNLAEV